MFKKIVLSMICSGIMVAGSNMASASDRHDYSDRGNWAEKRLGHKGDQVHRRFDRAVQRAYRNGHHRKAYHLDRHGTSRFNKRRHQHDQQCDHRRRHDKGYNKHGYSYAPMDRHSYRNRGHHHYKRGHTNGGAHVRGFSDNVSIWLRF